MISYTLIYLADPMRFGVQAYRHYLKPDGRQFLHAILRGESLTREHGGR